MNKSVKPKILFIHNSITWYRIPLFIELNKLLDITYTFTKVQSSEKYYKNIKTNYDELNGLKYYIIKNYFNIAWDSIKFVATKDYDEVLVTVLDDFNQCIESIICCTIAKIRKKKVAYFWERWEPSLEKVPLKSKIKKKIMKYLFKFIIKNSDCFIVPGTKTMEYFISCGAEKEKIFIANDVSEIIVKNDLDIREKHGIDKNKKIILYFGRILERKGLDDLINAFSMIEKNFDDAFLLICGDGQYKKYCEDLSEELCIKNILFTGIIQPEFRSSYYSQSNVFVLPSKVYNGGIEAWGLSVNEAMQCGKPVISTTAVGSAYDLITNGYNGYMVEENNIDELYKALFEILNNKELEIQMGDNSKKIINNSYKYSDMADGFKKAFMYGYNNESVSNKVNILKR